MYVDVPCQNSACSKFGVGHKVDCHGSDMAALGWAKRFMGLQNRNDTYNVRYCIHILVKPDFCDKSHTQRHNEYKHIFVDKKEHQFAGLLFEA